ncbi:MAG: stage V sporulation protein AA [Eubacteriales bacterium]|nr:stage V sporulation protein AA [Eubacteriales bacterium]
MAVVNETIYIKGDSNVEVTKPNVTLGDLVQMECANPVVVPKLKTVKVLKFSESSSKHSHHGNSRTVVSVLKLIECIHEKYPGINVQNLGEQDIIVTYENQQTASQFVHWLKIAVVVLISFAGSAFSIMAFNNDVDTSKLFDQIYELLMGRPSDGFTLLEVTYSIGILIGILVFFNHFGKKRFSVDPTPMEVEMRLYENDIQTTLVENYSRKGKEIDVGTTDIVNNHRS